nr:N-acetylmuramoyl-L-alanine amidase [uncultured Peptostreptococcus sp.]
MKRFLKNTMVRLLALTMILGPLPYSYADETNIGQAETKIEESKLGEVYDNQENTVEIKLGMAKIDSKGHISDFNQVEEDSITYDTKLDPKYIKSNASIFYLYGSDRYETSIQVSKEAYPDGADSVVLVNSSNPIYGLIATPFASLNKAPILLTSANSIKASTLSEIKRLKPKKVYMIGDNNLISKSISNTIKANTGAEMARIFGTYPSDLSLAVAEKIYNTNKVRTAYLVSTENGVADALSISSRASASVVPVLVTSKNYINNGVYKYLKDNVYDAYYIGGQESISNSLLDKVSSVVRNGGRANRIYGSDRYQTNINVINKFYKYSDIKNLIVAKAENSGLIDTVSAGPFAAIKSGPILITNRYKLAEVSKNFLNSVEGTSIYQIGGGISPSVTNSIKITFQSKPLNSREDEKQNPREALKPDSNTGDATKPQSNSDNIIRNITRGVRGKTIVIDPGHGGRDSGAVGLNGYKEKDWTLKTAMACADYLTKAGARVIMTRKNDTYPTLQDRADLSNDNNAVFFCSIHYNKGGDIINEATGEQSGNGVEIHSGQNDFAKSTAKKVLSSILSKFNLKNRGVKDGTRLYVISNTNAPAILVEGGFMSNSHDVNLLKSDSALRDMGIQIAKGIVESFNSI